MKGFWLILLFFNIEVTKGDELGVVEYLVYYFQKYLVTWCLSGFLLFQY